MFTTLTIGFLYLAFGAGIAIIALRSEAAEMSDESRLTFGTNARTVTMFAFGWLPLAIWAGLSEYRAAQRAN